ncbi:Iron-sulfur cluster assembly ATPase protein SufC [hydrothermal vent metagenome]|uniref:Iron-sulfur cluster assembly ATPase protein SufC n=1 Tax=hydrothermal vent metagenome TaxID=652676 RepID=A0A3B0SXQ2_9ZZZZ
MSLALSVRSLEAKIGDLQILKGVDLEVPAGEVHVLMGPNGSGKSTLCHVLTGKQDYQATGAILVDGVDVSDMAVDERARAGVFQAFQYPIQIGGVLLGELMDEMAEASPDAAAFRARTAAAVETLHMEPFMDRAVNDELSGGEKKRSEMLQLAAVQPKIAVLDEIDSGLDIDAVREVAELVERLRSPELGVLLITHYSRILRYMKPDRVHVMIDGRVVKSGGIEVAEELESSGYDELRKSFGPRPVDEEDDFLADL